MANILLRRIFFCATLAAASLSALPTELSSYEKAAKSVTKLSLADAIYAATTHHPAVKNANLNIKISAQGEKAAWSGYAPNISVTTNAYADRESGTAQLETAITANQYLIGFAGPKQLAAQAKIDTKIATISRDLTILNRRAQAEDIFLRAWLKQEELELWNKQFAATSENLRLKKRTHDTGLITDADYEAGLAETASIEASLESQKYELNAIIGELEDITGLRLSDDEGVFCTLSWEPDVNEPIKPVSFYIEKAFSNRRELDLNSAARERALNEEKLAKGKTLPSLSAVGSYSHGYYPGSTPTDPTVASSSSTVTSLFGGLKATWNIFDGALSQIEADTARAKALKSSTEKEITKKKISAEIKKIHSDLKITQNRTKALQAELKSTQEALRLTQSQTTVGISTDAELQTADAKNYKTQFACLGQVVLFQRSLFAMNAACGYGLESA